MPLLLKGQPILDEAYLKSREFLSHFPFVPHLAIILVGEDPASRLYVKKKQQAAKDVGFDATIHHFPETVSEDMVLQQIHALNADNSVHGILVQLPVPPSFRRQSILDAVSPDKDVDGLTTLNAGRLYTGNPFLVPCTPLACLHLIKQARPRLIGLNAMVVGQSTLVGKPMNFLLLQEGCTVFMANKSTRNAPELAKLADILVVATGQKHLVTKEWVQEGATLIDVGIHPHNGRVSGDIDYDSVVSLAVAITPVPGGVGPATIAYLLFNLMKAAQGFVSS